jgi:hypothetical protein
MRYLISTKNSLRIKKYFLWPQPQCTDGHVNLSPKDNTSFRILSNHKVAYIDIIGSAMKPRRTCLITSVLRSCFALLMVLLIFYAFMAKVTGCAYLMINNQEWNYLASYFEDPYSYPADHCGRYRYGTNLLWLSVYRFMSM